MQGVLADSCEEQQSSKGANHALQLADVLQDVLPHLHLDCIPGSALASICMGTGLLDAEQLQVSCSALCTRALVWALGCWTLGSHRRGKCPVRFLRLGTGLLYTKQLPSVWEHFWRTRLFCTLVQHVGIGCIPPAPVPASVCAGTGKMAPGMPSTRTCVSLHQTALQSLHSQRPARSTAGMFTPEGACASCACRKWGKTRVRV